MLTLKEFMELVDYKITEGSDYWPEGGWGGKQLYSLSAWNGDHNGWSFNIGFDPQDDQRVYVVEVCDYKHNRAYRLIDSSLKTDKEAWDGVDYIDLETDDDFIQKSRSIKAGEDYDKRVSVPLELPDDVLFELMKQAHERDITFNQLVEQALWAAIRAEESKQLKNICKSLDDDDLIDSIDELYREHDFSHVKQGASAKMKKKKERKIK